MAEETIKQTAILEGVLGEVRKLRTEVAAQNAKSGGDEKVEGLPPGSAQFTDSIDNLAESNKKNAASTQQVIENSDNEAKNSAAKEREGSEKRERTFARIGEGLKNVGASLREKAANLTESIFGKIPLNTLFGLGVMALISWMNSDQWKTIGDWVASLVSGLKTLWDTISGLATTIGESETFKNLKTGFDNLLTKVKEFLGPEVTGALATTFKALGAALAVGMIFAPFTTAGLLVKGTWMIAKLLASPFTLLAKGIGSMIGSSKAAGSAASAAAATAAKKVDGIKKSAQAVKTPPKVEGVTKGGEKVVKSASGKLAVAGADGKATARMVDPKDMKRTKVSSVASAVKDKFAHLKKFPKLLSIAKKVPFLGTALTGALLVATLSDPKKSKDDKIKAVGGVLGGVLGGAGGAKLGALAGLLGGPIGAIIGGLGGAFAGFFAGEWAGQKLAEFLMDNKEPPPLPSAEIPPAAKGPAGATGGGRGGDPRQFDSRKSVEDFGSMAQGASASSVQPDTSLRKTPESVTPTPKEENKAPVNVSSNSDQRQFSQNSTSTTVVQKSIVSPTANTYGFMNYQLYPAAGG